MCMNGKLNVKHLGLGNKTQKEEILEVFGLGHTNVLKSTRVNNGTVQTGKY